nr:hypothetical protein [Tanacetum cinerariifolium]
MAPVTRQRQNPPPPNTNTPPHHITPESVQAMIDQPLLRKSTNGDGSQSSHEDNPRHVQTTQPCFYANFMKCHPLNFKGNEGVVGLTQWIKKMESVFNISGCAIENQGELKKLEIKLWILKVKGNDVSPYTNHFQELILICTKFVANENEKIDKYISGLPDNIYENELSYNQNYDGNYYSHESPSFPCCDYCGRSHKTFQCQPIAQNIDFFGSDQIQNPQYPDVQENPLTNDKFEAYTIANNANMNDLQFKLDNFQKNQQDFQKKFEQKQDDFQNQMKNFMQNLYDGPPGEDKERDATKDMELPSNKDIQPLSVQEPPQNPDIRQLIREECIIEVTEKQKQSMEDTMLELVKICQEKEFLYVHDDVDDLIESALNSKLLFIKSQRLDKKEQEVKNVVEQPAERGNCNIQSLQNFKVVHKSSVSFRNTSQISSIHVVTPVLSTKEPEHLLSMGYEHLSITHLNSNIESLNDNSTPDRLLNSFESDNSLLDNFSPEFKTFCDHSEETRNGNTTHANYSLPEYDSFCFEIKSDQERLINLVKNNISDHLSSNSLLEEVDLFLSDNSIPSGIENFADDPEGDIRFLEELLIDDSILSHESSDSNFEDNSSIPRPPPEPPDVETDAGEEILVLMNNKDEDVDYSSFIFIFDKDRIVLNLLKISQQPGNINTRSDIRRKAGSESSVFKNKSYIEAQFIKNPKSKDLYCPFIKVNFKLIANVTSPGAKCVILPNIPPGTTSAKSIAPAGGIPLHQAYTIANDANMNDLQFKLDNFQKNHQDFQKKFEQKQDAFQNQMRNFMQNLYDGPPGEDKEHEATKDSELPSTKDIQPLPVQEPPQNPDIRQLIREECSTKVTQKQKQSMEDTMLKLVKICQEKKFLCIHEDVDDLIESALNSKLLLIKSQRLDKKKLEVKNVVKQPAERGYLTPILATKEPEHLLSMGYEHLSIIPEMKSDEVIESNAENLLPIPSECEVTLEDKRELEASLPDPEIVNVEEENVFHQAENDVYQEENVDFEDISQIQDVVLREKLLSITHLISNIKSFNGNSTPDRVLNSFDFDNSLLDNFLPEFETFCDHLEETRSGNTTHANYSLPEYDLFFFEIEPDQERLINLVKNNISDHFSSNSLLEEVYLFLSDNSIPSGIENFADDPEGDIRFLEELLIDDSILSHESSDYNFEDNPLIPRPPPEPPDVETDA